MSPARWLRSLATLAALTLGLLTSAEEADARLKSELSFGGIGPGALVSPLASIVLADMAAFGDAMPVYAAQPTSPGGTLVGLFSRPGLLGGFAAGFLGAGLVGVFFGQGIAGGLSGVASILGLIFQLALVVMLARLIWTWWRGDNGATVANLSPRQLADAYGRPRHEKFPDVDSPTTADGVLGEPNSDAVNHRARPQR
jgi:predicted lipid-binding transport protein (Tim44 family)